MQSWLRKMKKTEKKRHNKKVELKIRLEKANKILFTLAIVLICILFILITFLLGLQGKDWVIATMSVVVLFFSLFSTKAENINPIAWFSLQLITFFYVTGAIFLAIGKLISPEMNNALSRWLSIFCLSLSIVIEFFKTLRRIIDASNRIEKQLKKELK